MSMKLLPHLNKIIVVSISVFGAAISLLWACGPWFHNWMLTHGDQEMLKAPTTHFSQELKRILQDSSSKYKTVDTDRGDAKHTLDAALQDLRAALTEQSMPQSQRTKLLEQHRVARESLL